MPETEAILLLVALKCINEFVPKLVIRDSPLLEQVEVLEDGPGLENLHVGVSAKKKA